ncbi:MAG TPA: hypothetical protein VFH53_08680, partial [Phycisphaerae bacterium]|nr:hypothetical protein [Phycisphaerae bacterium]
MTLHFRDEGRATDPSPGAYYVYGTGAAQFTRENFTRKLAGADAINLILKETGGVGDLELPIAIGTCL